MICKNVIGLKKLILIQFEVFCFDCLITWRRTKNSAEDTKNCPECRTKSDYVVPSRHFVVDADKKRIIDQYKESRKDIQCRYEKNGRNHCRNRDTCIYKHTLPFEPERHRRQHYSYSIANANLILNVMYSLTNNDL